MQCKLASLIGCFLAGSAMSITYDLNNFVIPANQAHIEIHPIKGSGGLIEVSDLEFTAQDLPSAETIVVDVIVVPVNDAVCSNLYADDESCDWATLGIGTGSGADFEFCCTAELAAANGCQEGRSIVDSFAGFQGISRSATLSGPFPSAVSYSYIDENQPGAYAFLIMNCNQEKSIQTSGTVEWESYPKDSPFTEEASGLTLLTDLELIARDCEIDVDYFTPNEDIEDDDFIGTVTDYLHNVAEACNDEQIKQLNQAFDAFEECSGGVDLQAFIEDFPSGILGTLIECVVTTDWDQIGDWTDIDELLSLDLSDECLDFEFGNNAVGHGLREMALLPNHMMDCLKDFSPQVPACTLHTYPIPIVGGLLKPATCVIGDAKQLLDDFLKIEMGIWNVCLPDAAIDPYPCDQEDCILEGSLIVRGGNLAMPVSDAMERIAQEEGGPMQTALTRYKRYLDVCTDEWEGFTTYEQNIASSPSPRHSSVEEANSDDGGISKGLLSIIMLLVGGLLGVLVAKIWDKRSSARAYALGASEPELEMAESD